MAAGRGSLKRRCLTADERAVAASTRTRARIVLVGRGGHGPWLARLRAVALHEVACVDPSKGQDAREGVEGADVVVLLPSLGRAEAVTLAASVEGHAVVFAVGDEGAPLVGCRRLPADPAAVDDRTLRTRLNAAAARARHTRRSTRPGGLRHLDPTPPALAEAVARGIDVAVFAGAEGADEQIDRVLAALAPSSVPFVVVVHHLPSKRAAFRSRLARLAKGPVFVLPANPAGLEPGIFFAAAPLGRERPGPDLDLTLTNLVDAGQRVFVTFGSGLGDEGVWGARAVLDAGGAVAAIEPAACRHQALVQAACTEKLPSVLLSIPAYVAIVRRLVTGDCAANVPARRSPAA